VLTHFSVRGESKHSPCVAAGRYVASSGAFTSHP